MCGPNVEAFLLGVLDGDGTLDGPAVRLLVLAHAGTPGVLQRTTSIIDAQTSQPLTNEQLILKCFRGWPTEVQAGREPSVAAWRSTIKQPEAWTDLAFIQLLIDAKSVAAELHGVDDHSALHHLGHVLPCDGRAPRATIDISVWMSRHFVAHR